MDHWMSFPMDQFLQCRLIGDMQKWKLLDLCYWKLWGKGGFTHNETYLCDQRLWWLKLPEWGCSGWKWIAHHYRNFISKIIGNYRWWIPKNRRNFINEPLRDRYGTVTGFPLMLQISLLKSPRKTISVKIYRYGTVTGPLRGHFRDFHAKKIPMCEHFLGLLS